MNAIVAVSSNRIMGDNNSMLWHIPDEFKYFKEKTMGTTLIMGRKTFDSLPGVLPGRTHIVLTSSPETVKDNPDVYPVSSREHALALASVFGKPVFVIGGNQMFHLFEDMIETFYITFLDRRYEGDTHFDFPLNNWKVEEATMAYAEDKSGEPIRLTYTVFTKEVYPEYAELTATTS